MQDEECLNSSKQNMCWAPCLFWSMVWRIMTSREILKNNWRMKKKILDEPSCRDSMKNSGNERMIERKRSWKHKVKPCNDLDGTLQWNNWESLELQKEKNEASRTENVIWWPTPERKMNHLDETRIRIMLCVSSTNLNWWQATDLAYYYSSWKDWYSGNLEKVFNEPPVGFGKNEWIDMKTKEEESWTNHRKNWKWT